MTWFDTGISLLLLGLGLLHTFRLLSLWSGRRREVAEAAHAMMAFGMAAMFAPAADPLPAAAWPVLFALSAAWFSAAALRGDPGGDGATHHTLCALAMLFMLFLADGAGGHGHAAPTGEGVGSAVWISLVALVLLGYFILYTLRCTDQWASAGPGRAGRTPSFRGLLHTSRTGATARWLTTASMVVMLLPMV